MVDDSDIARLRRAHEAFSRGDAEGLLELCSPDVEFTTYVAEMEGRAYHGHEGVREWVTNLQATFDDFTNEILGIETLEDDRVLAELLICGTASGLRLEQRAFQLVEFHDGLATHWSWYRTREEAVAAAGGGA